MYQFFERAERINTNRKNISVYVKIVSIFFKCKGYREKYYLYIHRDFFY